VGSSDVPVKFRISETLRVPAHIQMDD